MLDLDKNLIINILKDKKGKERALKKFYDDMKYKWNDTMYYHFVVDNECIFYYSSNDKTPDLNTIDILSSIWQDFGNKITEEYEDNDELIAMLDAIFYYDLDFERILYEAIERSIENLEKGIVN
ncbi:hypothetical protein [Clostridium perfringens]|uniref:hypothetical protein n=1 Tax=Clostridium perfringens TaxID=1502 RepID=UPI000D70B8FA|nr:hypothetical protein [Clostridium perfringens]MBO3424421.1 hypothetical protein [Clostridium perfringens]PWX10399.1 hypothetical protein CYK69_14870 [Clostridium perfringens]PWX37275.1 hypothetical protein CYK94_08095 [Clostridium perfringens]PWX59088.1 hypothetical protein CYK88_07920 [Clostridium perfringens]